MRVAIVGAVLVIPAFLSAAEADPLPGDGQVKGWTSSGPARIFTPATLFDFMDGGAEIFLELGFAHLAVQRYKRGSDQLSIELYRMDDSAGALGIYLARCGREDASPALRERHTVGPYQLMLRKNQFFLVVNKQSGTGDLKPDMLDFARQISARLTGDAELAKEKLLPAQDQIPGSLRIVRGPVGLLEFITLGSGDVLLLKGQAIAWVARYHGQGAATPGRLLAVYPSAAAAASAFLNLCSHLDPTLEVKSKTDARLVFKDAAQKFGVATLSGSHLELWVDLPEPPPLP